MVTDGRRVTLRAEHDGADSRYLWAYVDDDGNLHIDGQDLGPGTKGVSGDGEYEWSSVIRASDVPSVVELLEGDAGEDVLTLLERRWTGAASYELEQRLRDSDIPIQRSVWS
jgi:hypothetical protein